MQKTNKQSIEARINEILDNERSYVGNDSFFLQLKSGVAKKLVKMIQAEKLPQEQLYALLKNFLMVDLYNALAKK